MMTTAPCPWRFRLLAGLALVASATTTAAGATSGPGGGPTASDRRLQTLRHGRHARGTEGGRRTERHRRRKRALRHLQQLHQHRHQQQQQEQERRHPPPQRRLQQLCSCAPRAYTLTLDLLNTCLDDTLRSNAGIAETDCTIEVGDPSEGGALVAAPEALAEIDPEAVEEEFNPEGLEVTPAMPLLDGQSGEGGRPSVEEMLVGIPWLDDAAEGDVAVAAEKEEETAVEEEGEGEEVDEEEAAGEDEDETARESKREQRKKQKQLLEGQEDEDESTGAKKRQQKKRHNGDRRRLQLFPSIPSTITSVTLIEINSEGGIIGINDDFTNVDFPTGTSFVLESRSPELTPGVPLVDQADRVPETTVIFLVGRNADAFGGEEVRGRFVWRYTNGCGANDVTIEEGDELGWNVWSDVDEASGEFCPASSGGGGVTDIPTFAPTNVPTLVAPPPISPTLPPTRGRDPPTAAPVGGSTPFPTTETPTESTGGGGGDLSLSMPPRRPTPSGTNLLDYFDTSASRSGKGSKRHPHRWNGKAHKSSKSRKSGKRGKGASGDWWHFVSRSGKGGGSKGSKGSKSSKSSKGSKGSSGWSGSSSSKSDKRR